MAMPPNAPLIKGNNQMNYFHYLAILSTPILKDEGINLDFTGYFDTIDNYKSLGIMEWKKALELSKEINAWSEYFSELSNLIQKTYLDIDLRSNQKQALTSIKYDSEKVSNGNRFAFQDEDMVELQKKRNVIKSLNDELSSKVRFLERAFYHCRAIGDNGHKSSYAIRNNIIKSNDKKNDDKYPGHYNPESFNENKYTNKDDENKEELNIKDEKETKKSELKEKKQERTEKEK